MVTTFWKASTHPVHDIYEFEHDVVFEKEAANLFRTYYTSGINDETKNLKTLKLISYLYYMSANSLFTILSDLEIAQERANLTVHKLMSDVNTLHSISSEQRFRNGQELSYLVVVLSRVLTTNYTIRKLQNEREATQIKQIIKSILEE